MTMKLSIWLSKARWKNLQPSRNVRWKNLAPPVRHKYNFYSFHGLSRNSWGYKTPKAMGSENLLALVRLALQNKLHLIVLLIMIALATVWHPDRCPGKFNPDQKKYISNYFPFHYQTSTKQQSDTWQCYQVLLSSSPILNFGFVWITRLSNTSNLWSKVCLFSFHMFYSTRFKAPVMMMGFELLSPDYRYWTSLITSMTATITYIKYWLSWYSD